MTDPAANSPADDLATDPVMALLAEVAKWDVELDVTPVSHPVVTRVLG